MIDLLGLINFTAVGSATAVKRAPNGVEGDPWPGIETWTAGDFQNAMDTLVVWTGVPLAGAAVHAQRESYVASLSTPQQQADWRKDSDANRVFDLADMRTTIDGLWIVISALKTASIPLNVPALDALTNDAAGKAGFINLWKQRYRSYLP